MLEANEFGLYFPPLLSVDWDEVKALRSLPHEQSSATRLEVTLASGSQVTLPPMSNDQVQKILYLHHRAREAHVVSMKQQELVSNWHLFQHNPTLRDTPRLPRKFLQKIAVAAHMSLHNGQPIDSMTPHPGCRCPYCQIAQAINYGLTIDENSPDEMVEPAELTFSEWKVQPLKNDAFLIIDPDDPRTFYEVYLKPKPTCSCGEPHCAHIECALRT